MNDFEKWFAKATRRFEHGMLKLAVVLLSLLFVSQYLLSNQSLRPYLNYMVRLEGPRAEEVFSPEPGRGLPLKLELALEGEPAPVRVLVNREARASFEEGRVQLEVKEGDLIEIDGQDLREPAVIRVVFASTGVKTPLVGHSVTTYGTHELLGWVTLD